MLGRPWIPCAVNAADIDPSRIRSCQARKHINGRGLSCTVGAQEAVQLALLNAEGNPANRIHFLKTLSQILDKYGFVH